MRHAPGAGAPTGLEDGDRGEAVSAGAAVLGEAGAVPAGCPWLVHPTETAPSATSAAKADQVLT